MLVGDRAGVGGQVTVEQPADLGVGQPLPVPLARIGRPRDGRRRRSRAAVSASVPAASVTALAQVGTGERARQQFPQLPGASLGVQQQPGPPASSGSWRHRPHGTRGRRPRRQR